MSKAISPLISYVLLIVIGVMAISIVSIFGISLISRYSDVGTFNEGLNNMAILASTIRGVASEGTGSLRSMQLSVSGGRYIMRGDVNTLFFSFVSKSGALQPGIFKKIGDVTIVTCNAREGGIGVDLKLNYNWVNFTDGNNTIAARGVDRVCVEQTGRQGSQTNMSVRAC